MKGPFFQRSLGELTASLAGRETIEDVEALYTIIVKARQQNRDLGEDDEQVALFSLCFFAWPGKSPAFREEIVRFRRSFAGIAHDLKLRAKFRSLLKPRLLDAGNVGELTPLNHISDVFVVQGEDLGSGAIRRGLPPQTSPSLQYFKPSSVEQPQRQMETS